MERIILALILPLLSTIIYWQTTLIAVADSRDHSQYLGNTYGKVTREDNDGVLEPDEYTKISENGSVTRRPCPYTCEDHGIPRQSCKMWRSGYADECYVEDTRMAHSGVFENHKEGRS